MKAHFYAALRINIEEQREWLVGMIKDVDRQLILEEEAIVHPLLQKLADYNGIDIDECVLFDWRKLDNPIGKYVEFSGNDENSVPLIGILVQAYLKRFDLDRCWGFTYAVTKESPGPNDCYGGALFISRDRFEIQCTKRWLADSFMDFERWQSINEKRKEQIANRK